MTDAEFITWLLDEQTSPFAPLPGSNAFNERRPAEAELPPGQSPWTLVDTARAERLQPRPRPAPTAEKTSCWEVSGKIKPHGEDTRCGTNRFELSKSGGTKK